MEGEPEMNFFTDIGRFIVEIIGYLWPLEIVWEWERGAIYVCGRYVGDVGPGVYPLIPFFIDVRAEGSVSATYVTPLQTITTSDGGTLTFSASFKVRVLSLGKAYNSVLEWSETAMEDTAAALAEKLASVDASKLEPASRGKLIGDCKQMLGRELGAYGLALDSLRFNNFVRNMKVYRLFNDSGYTSH